LKVIKAIIIIIPRDLATPVLFLIFDSNHG